MMSSEIIKMEMLTDSLVITASLDHTMRVWNIFENKLMFEIPLNKPIQNLAIVPGKYLIGVIGQKGVYQTQQLYVWDSIINQFDQSDVQLHGRYELDQQVLCLCVMSFTNEKYLVLGTQHGDLIIWDLETFEMSDELSLHNGNAINDIKECKINFRLKSCLITGSSDGTIKIISMRFDQQKFVELAQLNCGKREDIVSVAELRNYMIVGATRHQLYFWVLDNIKKPLKVQNTHTMPIYKIISVDDGQFVLSVGTDGKLGVWKGKNQKLAYHSHPLHNQTITDIVKIGDRIVTTSLDKTLRIHEIVYLFNNHEWV
eukprot:403342285